MNVSPQYALHHGGDVNLVFFESGCLWMDVAEIGGIAQINGLAFFSSDRAFLASNKGVRRDPVFFRAGVPRRNLKGFSDAVDWYYGGYSGDDQGFGYDVRNGLVDATDYFVVSGYQPFLLEGVLFGKQRSLVEVGGGSDEWHRIMELLKSFYSAFKMGWTGVKEYTLDAPSPLVYSVIGECNTDNMRGGVIFRGSRLA